VAGTMTMTLEERIDELLYLERLAAWERREPHMTGMCSIKRGSPRAIAESEAWQEWFFSKPKRGEP
jgi:hypothetical protein